MPTIKKKKNSRKLIFSIANTLCIDLLSADIWQTRKKDCRELLADWNNLPLYSLVNVIYHCYIFLPVNLDLTGRKCGQIKKKRKRDLYCLNSIYTWLQDPDPDKSRWNILRQWQWWKQLAKWIQEWTVCLPT